MVVLSNTAAVAPIAPLAIEVVERQKTVQVTEEMLYLNERTARPIY